MSVCAKFQLSSSSRSAWKFCVVVGGGVCKVIFMVNPTVVLRLGLGWGFDNSFYVWILRLDVGSPSVLVIKAKLWFSEPLPILLAVNNVMNYLKKKCFSKENLDFLLKHLCALLWPPRWILKVFFLCKGLLLWKVFFQCKVFF